MDERIRLIAQQDGPLFYIEIARLKEERLKLEAVPEPEKATPFQDKLAEMEKTLQAEVNQVCNDITQHANQDVAETYSPETLFERAKLIYRKEAAKLSVPYLMLKCFPLFKQALENTAYSHVFGTWANRFADIDRGIKALTAKIPAPFSEDKINKDPRFPASRIGQADGKYYDKWLSEFLKSKPILFDSPQYQDKLIQFYQTVFLAEHDKEHKGQQAQAIAAEKAVQEAANQPQPYSETSIPQSELQAMWDRPKLDYGMKRLRDLRGE